MKRVFLVASVLLLAGNCWAQSEAWDASKRSIFSRYAPLETGGFPLPPSSGPAGELALPPVPVFVGVIFDNDTYTGFVMTGDSTKPVAVGDLVGGSRVLQITMDNMHLSNGAVISVGYDLQNRLAPFNAGPNPYRPAPATGRTGLYAVPAPRANPRPARAN